MERVVSEEALGMAWPSLEQGSPLERGLSRLVDFAVELCEAPVAVVWIGNAPRVFARRQAGVAKSIEETAFSFCESRLCNPYPLVVEDVSLDTRFSDHPFALGESAVRSFASAPLIGRDGVWCGTLVVMDREVRVASRWPAKLLESLAVQGGLLCESDRQLRSIETMRDEARVTSLNQEAQATNTRSVQQGLGELSEILEHTPDFVFQTDARGHIQHLNPAARLALGLPLDAVVSGYVFSDFNTAEAQEKLVQEIVPEVLRSGCWIGETTISSLEHRVIPVNQMVICHRDENGRVVRYSAVMRDITKDMASRRRLLAQSATLHSIAESIPAIVAVNGADEKYRFVNHAFERWFGKSKEQIVGRTSADVLGQAEYDRSRAWIVKVFNGETVNFEKHFPNRTPALHMAVSFIPLRLQNGDIDGYVTMAQDVTQHRTEAVRLLQMSERDALTGLLNLRGFENFLDHAVQTGGAASLALLYVDLDHFKPVNDQHGHPVGDQLLREFASRLKQLVRPTDAVARLGGDEFAVVLSSVSTQDVRALVAQKILLAARTPFIVGPLKITISASVGLAFDASDQAGSAGLVQRADASLYQAKAAGRGTWA